MVTQASLELDEPDIKWHSCKSFGGIYLLQTLWKRFHFSEILSRPIRQTSYRTPILSAIFAMVANRCLTPSSKLAVSDWVKKRIVENQTGKTWWSVRDEMRRLYFGEFYHNGSSVRLLTELTKYQRTILHAMNINKPSTVVDIHQ